MPAESPSPLQSFSFAVNGPVVVPASGSSSPRTKVAHRFRGLALADHGPAPAPAPAPQAPAARQSGGGFGGGGVASAAAHHDNHTAKPVSPSYCTDMQMRVDEDEAMMRKRTRTSPSPDAKAAPLRVSAALAKVPETPVVRNTQPPTPADPTFQATQTTPIPADEPTQSRTAAHFVFDQAIFSSSPKPSPSKLLLTQPLSAPSNHPAEAVKSRVRKRAGTPPLAGSSSTSAKEQTGAGKVADVIDPIRAALTWHEDEITVYDPEDDDDDGVGINGIGFKPTPAIAQARTMKRRQQLAEYRKREDREARARRNLRRRGSPERAAAALESNESAARKVRFTEAEPSMMIETT